MTPPRTRYPLREMVTMMRRCTPLLVLGLLFPSLAFAQGTEEVLYFHTDAVGSVRMITDANGQVVERYDYLPFGEPWPASPTGDETRRFTGQERDPDTGLDYFGARYYASGNGRFTTPDDPSYMDPFDPQSMNRYAYAVNNPLRFVDPTGHEACEAGSQADFCSGVVIMNYYDADTLRLIWDRLFRPVILPETPKEMAVSLGVSVVASVISGGTGGAAIATGRVAAGRAAGRLTQKQLEHIVLRHWATSGAKNAGKFLPGTTARTLKGMINQAIERGAVRPNTAGRAGQIVEYDFGKQIGTGIGGNLATRLRVVLSSEGTVITAFPF